MYSKLFTRLFLLIGMIGMFSVPMWAEEVTIGSGTDQQPWLPSHSNYKCSYTQQIYTAEEIDHPGGGIINSIAFYNKGTAKTRTWDVYLINTDKSSFTGANNDWVDVSQGTLVFSGSISLTANQWTPITFTTPFDYTGSNLAVVVNDKTGSYSSGQSCLVFTPSGDQGTQAHYIARDGDPYDPSNPNNGYSSNQASVTYKNQIILDIEASTVTCAKPKSFNATGITAHTATLTWTAGAEGQSDWDVYVTTTENDIPDENTTPTYQITECSKSLDNLTAQTTYYAYVRANCGDGDLSKWASKTFTTTREAIVVNANHPYSQDFETNNDWGFTNGTQTNKWSWGSATNNGGTKSMYISNDNGTSYSYTVNSTTVVFASKLLNFEQGTYTFSFNWQAKGEGSSYTQYDYLRAILAPGDVEFTAGSLPSGVGYKTLPDTWIALDGGQQLNLQEGWQSQTAEATVSGTYTMIFIWRNDSSSGNQPPAAIDNISISYMTCPRPSNLTASNIAGRTATISWTENGTATNWVLQYATNSSFTDNLTEIAISGTAAKDLTGLAPETKYYARVKSVLGNEESSWSDVTDFTTTVTCPKPTNLNASNITTTSITLSWSAGGSECGWDISICETTSMHPETDGVIYSVSENPYTIEGLDPDKVYYAYVRANCAEEGLSVWSVTKGFTTLPTCIKPTNFSASNVTSSSATLSWTAGEAGQDAWNVMYKKDTDSEWTTVPVSTTTYTITGLSPVSTYYAKVQADCGEGDLSKWAETTFTTGCGAIDLPYTCDFEGTSQTINNCIIPSCWSVIRGYYNSTYRYGVPTMATPSTSTQPIVQQTHSGSYSLYFLNSTSYGTTEEYAILPEISDAYDMSNIQIRFWVRSYSSPCTMEVGVMTDPSNANTYVKIEDVEMTSTYTEKTINLNSYSGTGRYIALKCPAPTMYSQAFYVDDITVEIPTSNFTKDIDAYTEGSKDHYYLVASPIGAVSPEEVTNMLENSYDLYYFDQAATDGKEWINYRNDANAGGGFSLQPGKGYLYANSEDVTLTFTGTPYNESGQFDLAYNANATLKGWNLIGNPYSTIATLDKAYYRLNQDGNALSASTENNTVEAMEGVFVQATEAGQTANFAAITTTNGETDKVTKLNINVTQSRGASTGSATTSTGSATTLDNAIIRFDNGSMLGKFQLNPNKTKVYIPQGDKDYAIVRSAAQGEMPVNFKAEKNGSYTLNVSTENMGMHYLHLIDNMTGADVDLLADPSYSFEAKTTDYASRFRLVFDANENGASTSSATFAYYNGNNWVISNPATDSGSEATLQVIDIMGRILRSETLNGNAEISLDQPAGIYMLRLVNSNDVKVQKVVVR